MVPLWRRPSGTKVPLGGRASLESNEDADAVLLLLWVWPLDFLKEPNDQ